MKKNLFRYELAGDVDEFSDYFWLRRFDINSDKILDKETVYCVNFKW